MHVILFSLYRWLKTNGYYGIVKVKQTPYTPKPYKTPERLGEKWQIDVKYVPRECKAQPGSINATTSTQ